MKDFLPVWLLGLVLGFAFGIWLGGSFPEDRVPVCQEDAVAVGHGDYRGLEEGWETYVCTPLDDLGEE